jgi:hypothetical protein
VITAQVLEALDNATHGNGYPHEYERPASEIVAEIHDWSGLEGFDLEDPAHLEVAQAAVHTWRAKNPRT